MKFIKRGLTAALAFCMVLQSSIMCVGAETFEIVNDDGQVVLSSSSDGKTELSENMYDSWSEDTYYYTGSEIKLDGFYLSDEYIYLQEGTDYTVTYENNINAGTAVATFTGIGAYTGSFVKEFTIKQTDIENAYISDYSYYYDYNAGNPVEPKFDLYYNGIVLVEGVDYILSYSNNVNVSNDSSAVIYITGIGNFCGMQTQFFYIESCYLYSCNIDMAESYSYCGGDPVEPKPVITNKGNVLTENVDYTLEYDDNSGELGYHGIVITGINNYSGSRYVEYYVEEAAIRSENVTLNGDYTYNGKGQTPMPVVSVDGKMLVVGRDFRLSYSNNINAGTAYVTVIGMNGYTGTVTKSFKINPMSVNKIEISKIADANYTGNAVKPTFTVKADGKAVKSSDYTVKYFNNTNLGTASAVVTLNGNYSGVKTCSSTFRIILGKVTGLKATPDSTTSVKLSWNKTGSCKYKVYRYDSSKKTYKLLTTTGSTSYTVKNLSEATGYTYAVRLVNGSKLGPYTTVTSNTKISTPKLTLKSYNKKVTLSWNKNSKVDGYQIYWCKGDEWTVPHNNYYSIPSDCKNDYCELKKITKASTTSYTKSDLSSSKNYHFKIRSYKKINGKTVYSSWSSIQCKINTVNRLNAATLKSHNSYKIYNVQGKNTKTSTHTLTSKEKKILKDFANKHFKKDWSAAKKVEYTADWIRKNMKYGRIPTGSHTENIFVYKEGQCSDYNGALVEMMTYLGFDAKLIMGNRTSGGQHFWGEIKIDGVTYLLEVGEKVYDNSYWNYKWEFLCLKYSEADGGYKKNGKIY